MHLIKRRSVIDLSACINATSVKYLFFKYFRNQLLSWLTVTRKTRLKQQSDWKLKHFARERLHCKLLPSKKHVHELSFAAVVYNLLPVPI